MNSSWRTSDIETLTGMHIFRIIWPLELTWCKWNLSLSCRRRTLRGFVSQSTCFKQTLTATNRRWSKWTEEPCKTEEPIEMLFAVIIIIIPICHRNSWYMAWDGHWAHTRDWQAYHHYHRRHPGDNIPFPTPFHGSAKRKCGFFPQHHGNSVNCRCNHNFVCLA